MAKTMNQPHWLKRTVEVKAYQWMMVWILLLSVLFGGLWGVKVYSDDRSKEAAEEVQEALFRQYDECRASVNSRNDFRRFMVELFEYLDSIEPGDTNTIDDLQQLLEEVLPGRELKECEVILA
jgi:hypothetical protein